MENRFLDLVNFLAILVLSVAFHEAAHAWLADRFGDTTPRAHGRMTFNPFAHVHPLWTIALPAVLWWTSRGQSFMFLAWTPVSHRQMRNPRLHGMLTALGGPAASLLLGLACLAAMVAFIVAVGGVGRESPEGHLTAVRYLALAVEINVFGAAFNLIPVPPLDGSSLLEFLLPRAALRFWEGLRSYSMMLLCVLAFSGALDWLLRPASAGAAALIELGIVLGNGIAHG